MSSASIFLNHAFNFTNFLSASAASGILTSNTNPFLKGDSGFISPACQSSNNHSASSEDSAENHDERENAGSMASNEDDERTLAKSPGKPSPFFKDILTKSREIVVRYSCLFTISRDL